MHFTKLNKNFFSMVSFSRVDYGDLVSYATGVQASGLNPVYIYSVDDKLSEHIQSCQIFYEQKKLPWTLAIPDYLYNDSVEELFSKHLLKPLWEEVSHDHFNK